MHLSNLQNCPPERVRLSPHQFYLNKVDMVTTREGERQGCDSGVSELASSLSGVSFCLLG